MRKARADTGLDDMKPEYDFSKGVRGKYAKRYAEGTNVVLIDSGLVKSFPTSESVNKALRSILVARLRTPCSRAPRSPCP
jgi:hypothetical protein